jgi:beta-glucanase (GH16 family)
MKITGQKISLGFRRNNQINISNSCDTFVPGISTKFGYTYGKFEINASIEHNNAIGFILLSPKNEMHDSEEPNGYIDAFILNKEYLRDQSIHVGAGIRYGDGLSDLTYLNETQLSLIQSGFHIFVFQWNKMEMVWKIDQNIVLKMSLNKYFMITNKETRYAEKGQPFDRDFALFVSNHFSEGTTYEDINENFTDSQFIIDYIKYYKWNNKQNKKEINLTVISNTSTNDNILHVIIVTTIILMKIVQVIQSNINRPLF